MYRKEGLHFYGWQSIDDLCNPYVWLEKMMAFINGIQHKQNMDEATFEKMKTLFINTYPYIARHLTQKEKERVKTLLSIPHF